MSAFRDNTNTPNMVQGVVEQPWNHSFLQVCRWMEARSGHFPGTGHLARIGEELHPQNEALRLGQQPSTVFAPREIASAQLVRGRLMLQLYGLGVYGPGGPLPLHLTEEIHERVLQKRDTTLADFLDMFHHRWLSLFYRAWAQGQSAAGLDRPDDERFSVYVGALIGHHPVLQPGRLEQGEHAPEPDARIAHAPEPDALPAHARLAAAGHLARHARNPAGVTATLEHYFAMPFRLEEYAFQWLTVEPEESACLGCGQGLGIQEQGAVLGSHVPDRQCSVTLHAAPPDLPTYERLLPGGDWHARLVRWLRCFTGLELRWELRLALPACKTPPCALGRGLRLGRTGWLPARESEATLSGRFTHI